MNKELLTIALAFGCIAANASTNNYDLLGRKGSKMNSPMVYRNVDYSKAKKNEQQKLGSSLENRGLAKQAVGLKGDAKAIIGKFDPNGYWFKKCTSACPTVELNQGKWNLTDYLKEANKSFIYVKSDQKPRFTFDYSYVTANFTRSHLSGFNVSEEPYNIAKNSKQPSEILKNQSITLAPVATVNNLLHRNYLSRSNVGVYLAEEAVPVRLNPTVDEYAPFIIAGNASMDNFNTMPGYEMRAARAYRLVSYFSDLSSIYAVKGRPSNPADYSKGPQIYMGLHSYGGPAKKNYSANAQVLDNYIYNNRTVEIVASGNTPGKVSAEGFALNAITVGALNPFTRNEISYSGKFDNFDYDYHNYDYSLDYRKPDFLNYSHFYIDTIDYERRYDSANQHFSYKPFYEGTETATSVTAGMVSNMLSYNEFYKWHPEVVKAVMLNAGNNKKIDYNALVFNQTDDLHKHYSYYFIGDVNTLMDASYNSTMSQQYEYSDGKPKIKIKASKYNFKCFSRTPDGFEISIAWLNSGNDIAKLQKLPQIFEIDMYCTDGNFKRTKNSTTYGKYYTRLDTNPNDPYRHTYMYFDECGYNGYISLDIVLAEEDSRSENYGQMVLGLDIHPIYF